MLWFFLWSCMDLKSWIVKNAEHRRIDTFELWCWRRLLKILWTARRSHQFIPEEISPEFSLEGLMLKLKFQYFGHLMRRANSLERTLILEKIEGRRRRGQQRMRFQIKLCLSSELHLMLSIEQLSKLFHLRLCLTGF